MSDSQMVGSRGIYQYLTQYNSYNYNGSATIDGIVVHHWGVTGQKFENVIAALSGTREASAHYVLEAGKVACIIAPGLRAWHVARNDFQNVMQGIYDVNSHTIGIECRPECTEGDVETLCQLIADLWVDYGKVPIYGHLDFMATACPGAYYDKLDDIRARSEVIYNDILSGGTGTSEETEGDDNMGLSAEEIAWVKKMYANSKATAPDSWALPAVQSAVAHGITDGERPLDAAKREEVAIMIDRAYTKLKAELPKAQ